ncbi:MAG TPA: hypothetical protein VHE81_15455 [Lacipirellulaceae bacterium]|nr:hypothetical protein [Lacipirellulaceae bacterium]
MKSNAFLFPAPGIPTPASQRLQFVMFQAGRLLLVATQQPSLSVLERLDPPRRAAVIMALLGLTLVGVFLITFIMIGGHWVRRLARQRPGNRQSATAAAVAAQRLRDALETVLPERKTSDTVLLNSPSKDTKVEP